MPFAVGRHHTLAYKRIGTMTKGIYALFVLLLTVTLVASRRPSQSEGTGHRLAKSGKSKGKKVSPKDVKHNRKKGGKKGKKGEYDESWEEGK
jgi:hypothetical protein